MVAKAISEGNPIKMKTNKVLKLVLVLQPLDIYCILPSINPGGLLRLIWLREQSTIYVYSGNSDDLSLEALSASSNNNNNNG